MPHVRHAGMDTIVAIQVLGIYSFTMINTNVLGEIIVHLVHGDLILVEQELMQMIL